MNQPLQILNSSLISVALVVGSVYFLFIPSAPNVSLKRVVAQNDFDSKITKPSVVLDFIYQNDLFETFNLSLPSVNANNSIPAVPQFSLRPISPAPFLKVNEMMQPLALVLNGIVLASDEQKSIAIISDDTLKESIYYVGDQIKDAFIAKILKNSIVLFRSNGQQEIFFLRKDDEALKSMKSDSGWIDIIANIGQNQYQIDSKKWIQKIPNLGVFFELCSLLPVLKSGDEYAGLYVISRENIDLLKALGLSSKDLIVSLNHIEITNKKKMFKAFEEAIATKEEGTIEVQILRKNKPLLLTYVLREILPQMPLSLSGIRAVSSPHVSAEAIKENEQKSTVQAPFVKLDPRQIKMAQKKSVEDDESSDYYDTIMKIRKRLVDNMNQRSPYTHRR